MTVVVRSATLVGNDVAACRDLYAWYVEHTAVSFELEPPDVAEMRRRMTGPLETHDWLVAVDDDEVVAYAYGGPFRGRPAYRFSTEVSVYVAPGHGRRGLGRALYAPLLERLADRGYRTALGCLTLPNDASAGLHAAMGFEEIGTFPRVGWKHGAWHDTQWWARALGGDGPPEELR